VAAARAAAERLPLREQRAASRQGIGPDPDRESQFRRNRRIRPWL